MVSVLYKCHVTCRYLNTMLEYPITEGTDTSYVYMSGQCYLDLM